MLAKSLASFLGILLLIGVFCAVCPAAQPPVEESAPIVQPTDQPPPPRTPLFRGAGVPNMFGDLLFTGGEFYVSGLLVNGQASFPQLGGGRVKISENNKALPMDRVYFMYNHFQNGLMTNGVDLPPASLDRLTIGLEKTYGDGLWSVELRMPFTGAFLYESADFEFSEPRAGNLTVGLKRSLYQTCAGAAAVGLGVNTPTGGGITGELGVDTFTIHNDALYLIPWIGFLSSPNDRLFYQAFLQLDIATIGNRVEANGSNVGRLSQQNLLEVDVNVGYWLYQNPCACYLTGLAGIMEFHYNMPIQDAQLMTLPAQDYIQLGNSYNRMDIWNLTLGVHALIGDRTTIRAGAVIPLSYGTNRLFDSEARLSVNRYF